MRGIPFCIRKSMGKSGRDSKCRYFPTERENIALTRGFCILDILQKRKKAARMHSLQELSWHFCLNAASNDHAFALPHFGQNLSPGSRAVPHFVQKLPEACPLP